ncbi:2-oxo acid dehydrogenase subunit E2 [Luminiphilus sp. nBUS_07]|uniref:2-oxo acid dehydrogenase subunit E2 n=1 Tax=Luminiphilus sp. nBUS_07 TaxID=3395314 RepID=UPI003EBFC8F6
MSKQFEAVTIPKWGIEMTHGRIVDWRYSEGEQIAAGAELVDIETDKIVNSFEARVSGSLAKILVPEGEELPVGTLIGVLAMTDFQQAELEAFIATHNLVEARNPEPASRVEAPAREEVTAPVKISPALKRKLEKAGLSTGDVTGTGPNGRILKEDVDRALAHTEADSVSGAKTLSATQGRIAQALVGAQNSVPLFHIQRRLNVGPAITALKRENPNLKSAITLLLLNGLRAALARHPELNVQFEGDTVRAVPTFNVALAVSRADGAVSAPVVGDVPGEAVTQLAQRVAEMVDRARQGKLTASDHLPAAITISNLGMYDVAAFTAMVTPPQVMVLSVGRVQIQPVWNDDSQAFEPQECLDITLGCDHRWVNGAQGAQFLKTLADTVQVGSSQ